MTPSIYPLNNDWRDFLHDELDQPYLRDLWGFIDDERSRGKELYPRPDQVFAALNLCPLDKVKVVILGQDPYHGEGQAHGLSFSVPHGTALPPSLRNIFKELCEDLGCEPPRHGCLESWARQGVLLLNSVLTVEKGQAASHSGKGWEALTDKIVERLSATKNGLVFVLWGAFAQKKAALIDHSRHLVLRSAHPSPLSARRGFFGSRPFSKINEYLISQGKEPIEWKAIVPPSKSET